MKTNYTNIWEIDGTMVVADTIEDAIALYKKAYKTEYNCVNIDSVKMVKTYNGSALAILSVDENSEEEVV